MTNEKWIWLDMDGTFADLYSVNGWLDDLIAHNPRPYEQAKPMYNMYELLEVLLRLKIEGWNIGVISWLSKDKDETYERIVRQTKVKWLTENNMDLILDKILITSYGVCKSETCKVYGSGILVDDEERNRTEWNLGRTINAKENIILALRELLDK